MQPNAKRRTARTSALLCFAALATLTPPAAAATRHAVRLTLHDTIVKRTVTDGQVTNTAAGVFTGRPFGSGAIVQRVRPTPLPGGGESTRSRFTIYTKRGSVSGTGRSTRTPQPDGTVTVVATRRIRSGTGAYRDATGRLRVRGVSEGITTISRWRGYITY